MKKQVFTFALLLVFSIGFSQKWEKNSKINLTGTTKTETRSTKDYSQITIGGAFEVTLIKGKEGEIVVTADEAILEKLITKCTNSILEIKMENGSNYNAKIEIKIPIEEISKFSYSGSGNVNSEILLNASKFALDFSGSGKVNLPISSQNLKVNKTGSGDLILSGTTNDFEIDCTGSGSTNAKELKAQNTDASQTGSGGISIYASQSVGANQTGSGNIIYYGKPTKVSKNSNGSGSISGK